MIDKNSYTKEWIVEMQTKMKKSDPAIIERVIRAFSLLEQLKCCNLNFIFKGGTALILLLQEPHRFSIDIDIICRDKHASLKRVFDKIIDTGIFTRYEEDIRKYKNDIPKAHFKFFYNSAINKFDSYILLDILFENNPYQQLIELPITSNFFANSEDNTSVTAPSINCILGDKLTAYAPNTTGIPYGMGKEMEIIKQLFDISKLFDRFDNLEIVKHTFELIADKELVYRRLSGLTIKDVTDDIVDTSLTIAFRGSRKADDFKELSSGISKIKSFIYSQNFILESAVLCASKAAYLALLFSKNIMYIDERYDKKMDLSSVFIEKGEYKNLNSIKKFSPEAFFYWYRAIELLE